MTRMISTVQGDIHPDDLGMVLPHEHLFINMLRERRHDGLSADAVPLIHDLRRFARAGGRTVVDLTPSELTAGSVPTSRPRRAAQTRDPANVAAIAALSAETGVQVVLGTGRYRDPYLDTAEIDVLGVDGVAEEMIRDLTEAIPGTSCRAGVIGEIGADTWYLSSAEERVLRAAARASGVTGAGVSTHAARWEVGLEQIAVLTQEKVDPARVCIGHVDTVRSDEYAYAIAAHGVYLGIDTINATDAASIDYRVALVSGLIRAGHLERILLSHDICLPSLLAANGGPGFDFILNDFREALEVGGVSRDEFRVMTVENPRRFLAG